MTNTLFRGGVCLLAMLLIGCSDEASDGDQNRTVAQHKDEIAVVQRVDGGEMSTAATPILPPRATVKVVVVEMSVDRNGAVTLKNPRVQYGEPPNLMGNPPMFTAQLLDRQGAAIVSAPLWDPRWTLVWNDEKNRDSVNLAEQGDTRVILPFKEAMVTMTVSKDRERLASVDLSQAISEFCAKNRDDPDCRRRAQTVPPK